MSQAQSICINKYGGFLPDADSTEKEQYNGLRRYMKLNHVDKCWLGIKEKITETPHWINSTEVGKFSPLILKL